MNFNHNIPYIKFFWVLHCFHSSFLSLIVQMKIGAESPLKFETNIWLVTSKKSTQIFDEISTLTHYLKSNTCYKSTKETHHKVSSIYCAHLHWLAIIQTKLFHYVLFCSANFLLCGTIGNRANFYLKSIGSGKVIYIEKDTEKHPNVKRIIGCTLYSSWFLFLSASDVDTSSQQSILISSSTRLLVFNPLIYLICSILQINHKRTIRKQTMLNLKKH